MSNTSLSFSLELINHHHSIPFHAHFLSQRQRIKTESQSQVKKGHPNKIKASERFDFHLLRSIFKMAEHNNNNNDDCS